QPRKSWVRARKTSSLKCRRRASFAAPASLTRTVWERPMNEAAPLLRMEGISKRYGGVRALEHADLSVSPGRIHAILGENGAGKSTLIKIMAGVVAPDEGR